MVALSNCMVIGDKRKYLAMLLSLKTEMNLETGVPTDKLASDSLFVGRNIGSTATTATEVMKYVYWLHIIIYLFFVYLCYFCIFDCAVFLTIFLYVILF